MSNKIYIVAFDTNNKLINYYISDYGDFYYVMNEQINFEDDNISVNSESNIIEDTIKPNKNISSVH